MTFGTIDQAIEDVRAGRLVIVADDEDRESEGDLIGAAEMVTPEMINFMATHGRGLICMPITPERCEALNLPQMTDQNTESHETAFTVSVDAARRFGQLPVIVIDPHESFTSKLADVYIPCAVTGVEVEGTAYRMDGVPIRLKKVVDSECPSDTEIVARILQRVKEKRGGE